MAETRTDNSISAGPGIFLLYFGTPLTLGLCGWLAGTYIGTVVAGLVSNPYGVFANLPFVNANAYYNAQEVQGGFRFLAASFGALFGITLAYHGGVIVSSIRGNVPPSALATVGILVETFAVLIAIGWTAGTVAGNVVSDLNRSAGAKSSESVFVQILGLQYSSAGSASDTVSFFRTVYCTVAAFASLVLVSNTYFILSIANKVRRLRNQTAPAPKTKERREDLNVLVSTVSKSRDSDSLSKKRAVEVLSKIQDKESVAKIVGLLGDESAMVRLAALESLKDAPPAEHLAEIAARLKDADPSCRKSAVDIIVNSGAKEYAKDIAPLLSDPDSAVREAAAEGLAELGAREYSKEIAALLSSKDWESRIAAIDSLTKLEAKEFAGDISKLLKDEDPSVRGVAASALARLSAADFAAEISVLLKDPDAIVRGSAIWALGQLDARKYADEIRLLENDASSCYLWDDPQKTKVCELAQRVLKRWAA